MININIILKIFAVIFLFIVMGLMFFIVKFYYIPENNFHTSENNFHISEDYLLRRIEYVTISSINRDIKKPSSIIINDNIKELNPNIIKKYLPYEKWEDEYLDYFERHYKEQNLALFPGAIVIHYTATENLNDTLNIFIQGGNYDDGDVGIKFGHLSVHFVIDRDGTIYQTLPLNRRCRGAYGVNHIAISIEIVARDETELLQEEKAIQSSIELVKYLMKEYNIPSDKVWGHHEISIGKSLVHEYTDYGDSRSPDCYPEGFKRTDPGEIYMEELRRNLSD